ncbi:MAG TPA: phytanoyl-CoA dioxygenase family protein [Polyangiaceae bacterium]|nr:phytanoyl-CoA dioxygenase family protein [Polyangiaceae bacterium]
MVPRRDARFTHMGDPAAFFRDVERVAFWRELVPWLHVEQSRPPPRPPAAPDAAAQDDHGRADGWTRAGHVVLRSVLPSAMTSPLARAISALGAAGVHPTFVYVYDETWQVIEALRPWLAPLLGEDHDVLADAWAFLVDPRVDRGGWPIHRGWYEDVRDATGSPGLANVWVALTEATTRNACMHVVPLSRDPHYPHDLRNLAGLDDLGVALPVPAGSALVWSANVAHWGGRCDAGFDQPRVSVTFTVRRRGFAVEAASVRQPLTFRERLDLVAAQLVTYGDAELGAERAEMRWASMIAGIAGIADMARATARGRGQKPY